MKDGIKHINNKTYTTEMGFKFHMAIAEISKNKILGKFLTSITDELNAQRFNSIYKYLDYEELIKEVQEHIKILECFKQKEAQKAHDLINEHIANSYCSRNEDQ